MKAYDRMAAVVIILMTAAALMIPGLLPEEGKDGQFFVDVRRIEKELVQDGYADAADYSAVAAVVKYEGQADFYDCGHEYVIADAGGALYRIDRAERDTGGTRPYVFAALATFVVITAGVLIYIRQKIIKPFGRVSQFPYELAKGNLTMPLEEQKSRFFGKFVWGLDMLREKLESSDKRELEQAREEKTMLLSLSHDIKTPLSSIKLYAKALSKGIYADTEKQRAAADSINAHADEIEAHLDEMISGLKSGVKDMEINNTDYYLDDVINRIKSYYEDRLRAAGTQFTVDDHTNCMLYGDPDRLTEVLQNIFGNAVKYGDGRYIRMTFSDEEDCRLITVTNSGCTLDENEMPHIFDSFWRGSNSAGKQGSGLGLYICRRLMNGMKGDIFARTENGDMSVTAVCRKA